MGGGKGGGDLSAVSHNQTWQFPTQGPSELTYAEDSVPQVQSYLRVLSAETTEEAEHYSVLVGGSQAPPPVSRTRAKLVETVGRLTEPQSLLP